MDFNIKIVLFNFSPKLQPGCILFHLFTFWYWFDCWCITVSTLLSILGSKRKYKTLIPTPLSEKLRGLRLLQGQRPAKASPDPAGRVRRHHKQCQKMRKGGEKKQKRGKRSNVRCRLKDNLSRPVLLSDYLRVRLTTQSATRSCVFIFMETWLQVNIWKAAIELQGLIALCADSNTETSGKALGSGLCVYINKDWCQCFCSCYSLLWVLSMPFPTHCPITPPLEFCFHRPQLSIQHNHSPSSGILKVWCAHQLLLGSAQDEKCNGSLIITQLQCFFLTQ